MDWEDKGQGFLKRNLHGKSAYESFTPAPLQDIVPVSLDDKTARLLNSCSRKLGELEGMLRFVPNAEIYLAMYVRKEALLSAQIEGTQCTFDDILDPHNSQFIEREVGDVIAYVRAAEYAVDRMQDLPLSMRLLREVHKVLLADTRGADREPGETRISQNWIGPNDCTLSEAAYVPPNVEDMTDALSDLERFINEADEVDPIIKAALVHYQFETIHPFLDGNGRLGRLLITLSLLNDNVLSGISFYPSYQFKLNRTEYYERLTDVRCHGSYGAWIAFFCKCLLTGAEDAIDTLEKLVNLHERNTRIVDEALGRSHYGFRLLELLEGNPIVETRFIAERLKVSRTTASNLVNAFIELGILELQGDRQRYRVFYYKDYLEILRQGGNPL